MTLATALIVIGVFVACAAIVYLIAERDGYDRGYARGYGVGERDTATILSRRLGASTGVRRAPHAVPRMAVPATAIPAGDFTMEHAANGARVITLHDGPIDDFVSSFCRHGRLATECHRDHRE